MLLIYKVEIIILCYIWGSIPFGYIITKHYSGKDICTEGSGNIGSTNVGRIMGRKWSYYTQILDILKGLLPIATYLIGSNICNVETTYMVYIVALVSIMGHNYSIFLKFKGGKGVNTTLGASVILSPVAALSSIMMYFLVKKMTKYVSVASMALAVALPLFEFITKGISNNFYFLSIAAALIIIRHKSNISRLTSNEENLPDIGTKG